MADYDYIGNSREEKVLTQLNEWALEERGVKDAKFMRAAAVLACFNFHRIYQHRWSKAFFVDQAEALIENTGDTIWKHDPSYHQRTVRFPQDLWDMVREVDPDFSLRCYSSSTIPTNMFIAWNKAESVQTSEIPPPEKYHRIDSGEAKQRLAKAIADANGEVTLSTGQRFQVGGDNCYAFARTGDDKFQRVFFASPMVRRTRSRYNKQFHSVWAFGTANAGLARKDGRAWAKQHYDVLAELQ